MAKNDPKSAPARQSPGPGRSTAEAAFNDLRKEIAQRNEQAHIEARKLRTIRERKDMLMRRARDY